MAEERTIWPRYDVDMQISAAEMDAIERIAEMRASDRDARPVPGLAAISWAFLVASAVAVSTVWWAL